MVSVSILNRLSNLKNALIDVSCAFKNWRIWTLLAWQDIRLRYRRSTLGPLWITLSMGITIYTMGLLYGTLFKMNLKDYYPFLASGMLVWALISTCLTEGTNIFIESENFLKQMKQPYLTFILRVITRNFIIFFHNVLIMFPIILFFQVKISLSTFLVIPGLILVWLNAIIFGTILAIFGTRYRDLTQLVNSLMQVIFFITPIMWSPSVLPERYHYVTNFNPFTQFIELIRNPMLGMTPSYYAYFITLSITLVGLCFASILFAKYRARIVYWL